MGSENLTNLLTEKRVFQVPPSFLKRARVQEKELKRLHALASRDAEGFWSQLAREKLTWRRSFTKTLLWDLPQVKWFYDGELNASEQCLDRHLKNPEQASKTALIWEGEAVDALGKPLERRTYTYRELHKEVCQFATGLKKLGVQKGDRVAIYMPLIPETTVAMLACARLGAIHSVVFGGFAATALKDRIEDAQVKFVITATGGYRRGKIVSLKKQVDEVVQTTPVIQKVIVVDRFKDRKASGWNSQKDHWYDEVLDSKELEAVAVNAEDPLFILYTSGTTGKPKGLVHSTAGYMLWAQVTCEWVFDLQKDDVYWCTADVGWITGHTYVVYGPLACGATVFIYEGAPDFPSTQRFWDIIEREKITIFYTAPTAIRSFMRHGEGVVGNADLKSLRLLGSVGEPINPEAWMWYARVIGGGSKTKLQCPIVDTWWQTETGGIMISPIPGATATKPGSATFALPGIEVDVVDDQGQSVPLGNGGKLIIRKPWPSQARTIWGDPERYKKTYWSNGNYYFTGDGAHRDADGYLWLMGRIYDVLNVAGHRLGTMEIESALVSHPGVAEAAVVGKTDDLKGTVVCAFVTLKKSFKDQVTTDELKQHVAKQIGAIARPEMIRFTDALPKTRSGKIMRRLLRDIAEGKQTMGDTSTLEDLSVLSSLQQYQDE